MGDGILAFVLKPFVIVGGWSGDADYLKKSWLISLKFAPNGISIAIWTDRRRKGNDQTRSKFILKIKIHCNLILYSEWNVLRSEIYCDIIFKFKFKLIALTKCIAVIDESIFSLCIQGWTICTLITTHWVVSHIFDFAWKWRIMVNNSYWIKILAINKMIHLTIETRFRWMFQFIEPHMHGYNNRDQLSTISFLSTQNTKWQLRMSISSQPAEYCSFGK